MYSLNTKDRNIVSLFQRARKNIIIKNIVLSLSLTLASFFVSEKYAYAQESKIPVLSYSISDLETRLSTYSFVDPDLTFSFPLEGSTIAKLLINFREIKGFYGKRDPEHTAAFSFIRDDAIFLITILRIEKQLQKRQSVYDETCLELTAFTYTDDLKTQLEKLSNIVKSIRSLSPKNGSPTNNQLSTISQLQMQQKTLETEINDMINKNNYRVALLKDKMEIVCTGSRDLLPIIDNLRERLHTLHVSDFSEEESNIIKSDFATIQDIYINR